MCILQHPFHSWEALQGEAHREEQHTSRPKIISPLKTRPGLKSKCSVVSGRRDTSLPKDFRLALFLPLEVTKLRFTECPKLRMLRVQWAARLRDGEDTQAVSLQIGFAIAFSTL